ncbi:MAG: XdhC family protein [Rhodospirillaceae bacterium]|nr:XdhC family protein [Rhodospirillaceae bacterium]
MADSGGASGSLALSDAQLTEVRRMMAADTSGFLPDSTLFVRVYGVAPRLIVVGAVHIAQALVPIAKLAGFEVIVIDPRAAFLASSKLAGATAIEDWPDDGMAKARPDARTAVVTLTHDPKLDDPALAAALRSPAFYIGALGSRKTHAKRLQRLKGDGFDDAALARIHGPVGLDINAVSPAEIAVSIVAQLVATLRAEAK